MLIFKNTASKNGQIFSTGQKETKLGAGASEATFPCRTWVL